jgi:hypothetical protein
MDISTMVLIFNINLSLAKSTPRAMHAPRPVALPMVRNASPDPWPRLYQQRTNSKLGACYLWRAIDIITI